ncbi:MAG: PAS domain S-box protein [Deltaproteobacteria bacterium]|jgi:PAS domain S-box-containing protein|nr:PAS domain S-box protein [Deltaproteobacteria bacterium]
MGLDKSRFTELQAKLDIYKSTLTEIYERYDQKLEELSLVRRVGDALRTTQTVESLAQALMALVAHEVEVDRVSLLTRDPQCPGLFLRAAYYSDREEFVFYPDNEKAWSEESLRSALAEAKTLENNPVFLSGSSSADNLGLDNQVQDNTGPEKTIDPDSWTGQVYLGGLIRDLAAVPARLDPLGQSSEGPRALALVPLATRSKPLGLLVLSRPAGQDFTPENERMLSIMADQASAALSNVLLFDDLSRVNQKILASEKRARETSDYLERLLETANDAILILDERGLIVYANRKAGQWGFGRQDLVGQEFRLLLEPSPELAFWEPGQPPPVDRVLEANLTNAQGERRALLISTSQAVGSPVAAPSPESSSFMLMVSDLTERRQLERQLLHSEKLASIGLLAAGVAHEVGNPLSTISGYAQILVSGADDESKEYLAAILEQTTRIQKILKELLDYSRPAQGLTETLSLPERLPRILGMLGSQKGLARLTIKYDFEPLGPYLVAMDRDHLTQVVIIIAMNAAQAMDGQTEPEPTLMVGLAREGAMVVLRLADNGPGMSERTRRRAFDPFFTTKAPGQGTGLGLAICQRIIDSYHGRLELTSAPGEGAAFAIYLPAATNESA